jgi:hypothetical protein
MAISSSTVVAAAGGQVACSLGDEVAVLNLATGAYYTLDEVGAAIWARLAGPISVSALRDALLGIYDVDAGQCERDLVALLEQLHAAGLVEIGGAGEEPAQ